MAKSIILTFAIRVFSFPFLMLSSLVEAFGLWNLAPDIERCLKIIDSSNETIPSLIFSALVAAEDHRNAIHLGVDPISMLRALFVKLTHNQVEGASTIEQQFVRTVLGHYQRSVRRKVREQLLAIAVLRRRRKDQIATAYLSIAFFGSGCVGIDGLTKICGLQLEMASSVTLLQAVAQLKYPAPLCPSEEWHRKIEKRVSYVQKRMAQQGMVEKVTDSPISRSTGSREVSINCFAEELEASL